MRSLVMFVVSHDETTDFLQDFVESTAREYASGDIVMEDYAVRVDIPECFALTHRVEDPVWSIPPVTTEDVLDELVPDPWRQLANPGWRVRSRREARENPVSTFH